MDNEKLKKEQNETIKNHYLIIFISTPIYIGLFYSIFFFSMKIFLIFTILSVLISYYLISKSKNKKGKKKYIQD